LPALHALKFLDPRIAPPTRLEPPGSRKQKDSLNGSLGRSIFREDKQKES